MKKQRISNLFVLLIVFGIAPMDTVNAVGKLSRKTDHGHRPF